MNKTLLGLDTQKNSDLVKELNGLLANFQIFYQNPFIYFLQK